MSFTLYKKIIDEVKPYIIYQMLYFQGEPFLNSDIFEMIKYSDSNKIYTSLSTNGHYLTKENNKQIIESGLKKLIVSVDGITQESYHKYRVGGNLNTVLNGIQSLIKTKQDLNSHYPKLIVQFLVFKHNEHEIEDIQKLCKKLRIKLELKSAQIYDVKNSDLIPDNKRFARYYKQKSNLKIKSNLKNRCFRIWSTVVITWEGLIIPCCFDKYNQHIIGNILADNTLFLWKSDMFNKFRKKVLKNRTLFNICRNCTEGLKL